MTQAFPYGGVEIMHSMKGSFKVNEQRSKPYFEGDSHARKQAIHLSAPNTVP